MTASPGYLSFNRPHFVRDCTALLSAHENRLFHVPVAFVVYEVAQAYVEG